MRLPGALRYELVPAVHNGSAMQSRWVQDHGRQLAGWDCSHTYPHCLAMDGFARPAPGEFVPPA